MFCKKCGKELEDGMTFCPYCGANQADDTAPQENAASENGSAGQYRQPNADNYHPNAPVDSRSGGFAFLCFLFPLIGLILYLVWKDTMPLRAKSCGKGAIIGVIVYFVFIILYTIIIVAAASSLAGLAAIL